MAIDLSQLLLELDGSYIKIRDNLDSIEREMTLKDILIRAMTHVKYQTLGRDNMIQEQLSPEEIGKRYELIKKLKKDEKECDFTHDEKTLLRNKLSESQHPWIAGQAMEMLK